MTQPARQSHPRACHLEAAHALDLEEAARAVLREAALSWEDRAVLEDAVRIARTLRKRPEVT